MSYKIFKFGGASVKDGAGVCNLQAILNCYSKEELIVVISAIGKTTNLLEEILYAYYYRTGRLPELLQTLKENHYAIARELPVQNTQIIAKLNTVFSQLEARLEVEPSDNYDFDYDQIVSFGELLSTKLISTYLNTAGMYNQWLDARNVIRTDNNFREGRVNWEISAAHIRQQCEVLHATECRLIITQGFIGSTIEKLTTTLGREGSDYTAAIFAYSIDAKSVTIWKDVPGLLNADPKFFPDAVKLDRIAYEEAIELSYYGASIIHPKTLKPLQNKAIPLYVKSFFQPEESGSLITATDTKNNIPSIIFKANQILISLFPKDFSFIDVEGLSHIFAALSQYKIKINLLQNSALSFSICTDYDKKRVEAVIGFLTRNYKVKYNDHVSLITIRHYNDDVAGRVLGSKQILIEQRSRTMLQVVTQ
ncbi:MAG: aspartate kinase [Bacteroidales bacterium]|jgi:aspartate kinase|nr:aspartate kinase [Bacteroidales bacterium]